MRILLVEDEEKLARLVARGLEHAGYTVDTIDDGVKAESRIKYGTYDVIVLDIMLPGQDGIAVCTHVREAGILTPIIMLTAKDALEDKLAGLNAGADDYLTKPFEFEELKARLHVLLRRSEKPLVSKMSVGNLCMDTTTHRVYVGETEVMLTLKEYAVLEYLLRHKNQVVDRGQILDHCWGYDFTSFSNIVDVYVKRVRNKLQKVSNEKYITTIRGVGYTIEDKA